MELDKNKITLRKAGVNDIDMIIDYRIIFLKEVQSCPSQELESILRQTLKQYLKGSLKNESFISWIAEYENKSIGFSGMVIREQPGNFEIPNGKTGYILNMYTIKKYRKNGIASLLLQKLIDDAKLRNLDRLELHATSDGEPIYKQIGFIEPHDKVLELIIK